MANDVFILCIFCRINGVVNIMLQCFQVTFSHHSCTCFGLIPDPSQLNTKLLMVYHNVCHNTNIRGGKKWGLGCSVFQNPGSLLVKRKGKKFFSSRKGCFCTVLQSPAPSLCAGWLNSAVFWWGSGLALSPSCCPPALLVCLDHFQSCVSCSPGGMELETTPLGNDCGLFLPLLEGRFYMLLV